MLGSWVHFPRYGVEDSYKLGMEWLSDCPVVEDWGCGPAYAKKYCKGEYYGVDGTEGFCDLVADLRTYTSYPDGIFMRHVLEHNKDWPLVLENALGSFQKKMSLILFLPFRKKTEVLREEPLEIAFSRDDIYDCVGKYVKEEVRIERKDKPLHDTLLKLCR